MEKENNGMSENEASVQLSETSELPSERKVSFKQILINALIFVAVLALTLTVLFREVTPDEIFGSLKTISMPYIAGGIIMMCIYILMESLNIKRTMSVFGTGLSYHMALKYAVVGFFQLGNTGLNRRKAHADTVYAQGRVQRFQEYAFSDI